MCASWGFEGDSADADVIASRVIAREDAAPSVHVVRGEDWVRIECGRCGTACRVLAPVVPGLAAHVAVECEVCEWVAATGLGALVRCRACRARAMATWTDRATPSEPEAVWPCSCGATATMRVGGTPQTEHDRLVCEPVPDDLWPAQRAARRLLDIEDALRRLEPDVRAGGEHANAVESLRSGVVWARALLQRAARALDPGDLRHPFLREADVELARAGEYLGARDLSGAADAVASATRTLDALLIPAEGRRA